MKDLIEYCQTDRQREILEAVNEHGSQRKAAAALGVNKGSVDKAVNRVKAAAAKKGYSPDHDMVHTCPDGYKVKGVSTYYNKDGKPTGQWVKSTEDRERRLQIMREACEAFKEDIPRMLPIKSPKHTNDKLVNCYTITDYHLGALSWPEETGAAWDLQIAEDTLVRWMSAAIASSPDASHGVLAQLGDFMHYSGHGLKATTEQSGHILDADGRFQKLVRVTIRVTRKVIDMLLSKHERVTVVFAEGNHDISASCFMREMLAALYADEPRITVDTSADPYYCVEHGKTLLFYHHGHLKKLDQIETVFIAKFREQFGRSKHAFAHLGHFHHDVVRETNTMKIEQHRTLAAPDSHASRGGWISGRDAKVITYHSEHGEVSRITINSDMLA